MSQSKSNYPRRGEIYYIKKGTTTCTGSEIWSNRYAVIVSANRLNKYSSVVQVVYITTKPKSKSFYHVDISTEYVHRVAQCEQVTPIDKSRIGAYKGFLKPSLMRKIDKAISGNLDLS